MKFHTGEELIKHVEAHCEEKLECSRRLRLHITSEITRALKEYHNLQQNLHNVIDRGYNTYDPSVMKAIYRPKSERKS